MEFVLENIIRPLIIAFFSVVGGALPLGILLYIYAKKEKNQLLKTIPYRKNRIKENEDLFKKARDQRNALVKRFGDEVTLLSPKTKLTQELKNAIIAHLTVLRSEETKRFIQITEGTLFISYAENYNFWTVLRDILKRKYIGPNLIEEKLAEKKKNSKT